MYGDNCGLERRIAIQMVAAWQAMGRTALVLNDGTRGDLILEREDGRFLVVQLKTTHGKAIGHTDYEFQHVHGYTRMPVVCWCEAEEIGWVADGTALDARTTSKLDITPGASLEREYTLAKGCMQTLLDFLVNHMDDWDSSTEDATARLGLQIPSKRNARHRCLQATLPGQRLRLASRTEWPCGYHDRRGTYPMQNGVYYELARGNSYSPVHERWHGCQWQKIDVPLPSRCIRHSRCGVGERRRDLALLANSGRGADGTGLLVHTHPTGQDGPVGLRPGRSPAKTLGP